METSSDASFSSSFSNSSLADQVRMQQSDFYDQYDAMRMQEDSPSYRCSDYLSSIIAGVDTSAAEPIDTECRVKMIEWCFQVVDFAKLHRETVSIAISILDRYLATNQTNEEARKVLLSRKLYQLASMAALFISIKINEKIAVNASIFSGLSRGGYTELDIIRMESNMLHALEWRVNCPTTHGFLRHIMMLASERIQSSFGRNAAFAELCTFQLDLSVGDYFFCLLKPSVTTVAAILNAAEHVSADSLFGEEYLAFIEEISVICDIDLYSCEMQNSMSRLKLLLTNNGVTIKTNANQTVLRKERHDSPTCVSRLVHVVSNSSMSYVSDHSEEE